MTTVPLNKEYTDGLSNSSQSRLLGSHGQMVRGAFGPFAANVVKQPQP